MKDLKIVINDEKNKPIYGTTEASCMDLFASETITIEPFKLGSVGLGIKTDFASKIYGRSSLPRKKGLILSTGVGVIDSDYRGELKAEFFNITDKPVTISKYERIVQFQPEFNYYIEGFNIDIINNDDTYSKWDEISKTKRGDGGFGSTKGYSIQEH